MAISLASFLHAEVKNMDSTIIKDQWEWRYDSGDVAWYIQARWGRGNGINYNNQTDNNTYRLSGFRNYIGGPIKIDAPQTKFELGGYDGNSFTSVNWSTTNINFKAKEISINNFLEINNRIGTGLAKAPYRTNVNLEADYITNNSNGIIYLYDGSSLTLSSKDGKGKVDFKNGEVYMGKLQYPTAYSTRATMSLDASKVKELHINTLRVGDQNATQATIKGSQADYKDAQNSSSYKSANSVRNLFLWQDATLNFSGSTIHIANLNTRSDGNLRYFQANVIADAKDISFDKVNLKNSMYGRAIYIENRKENGNITLNGSLALDGRVGGDGYSDAKPLFHFRAKGKTTFEQDIALGAYATLRVDGGSFEAKKSIDASRGSNGSNATSLYFRWINGETKIHKLITSATNIMGKTFNIGELSVKVGHSGSANGYYTHFHNNIGISHIGIVRLEKGTSSYYQGGVLFNGGTKLTIDELYHQPWNFFDARKVNETEITKRLVFASPGGQGLIFNNLTLGKNATMEYGKDLSLSIAGNFTNNQGAMVINTQDNHFATLAVGGNATMKFNNLVNPDTGFYKPIIKINSAQTLTKNKDHVILTAKHIDYVSVSQNANTTITYTNNSHNHQAFKDRLALYNSNDRMDICVIRGDNHTIDDIKSCGRAIGDSQMQTTPEDYKYLAGKAWRYNAVVKTADSTRIAVNIKNSGHQPERCTSTDANVNTPATSKCKNNLKAEESHTTNLPVVGNKGVVVAHSRYALTPNLIAINKHNFGTIESVFELANRSDAINVINATSGTQGRDLLQTLLIDSHNAGYARQMIDATSTGEITKQLNVATETLNNIASLEHKTNSLQTLSLSNKMVVNTRLVNLSRKHTNNIDSFAKRLQALQDKRFASVGTMAEVLYQFAPKYEKPANVWANAIGGASLSNGGNTSLYGTSAGMDTYIEGENVEAIVGGFGSYGYSSFNNQASNLNSGANNTNFGLYSRVFANKHEFDFEAQGAVGSNNENLMFKGALLQGLNQGYSYLAYSAMANANYGYDFAFLNNALVFKPSVGVSYNHLGSTNMKSNSNQVALSNGASSRHLLSANANVEARYYYGDTSFFYMNAGILQELANFGFNNAMALNSFKVNATHNPLNTHARVMIGGELQLAKEVYLNLGVIYAHNLNTMIGNIASNLGMRYSF
nr:vacuolating cyotoxin family protein [Helicobacter cetorum]